MTEEESSVGGSLRDRDLAQWLENKFGVADERWKSKGAAGLLSGEIFENLVSCFVDLQTHVKLRILIGIMHLSKRNLDQGKWRDAIEGVLHLAVQDTDEWVQTIAELLRDFCTTGAFNFSMDDSSHFVKTLAEIRKLVRQRSKRGELSLLPLDAASSSKTAVESLWGNVPNPSPHFQLKRRPKSATVRADLLQKSNDIALLGKSKTAGGSLSSVVPIRARSLAKKMDNTSPLRGLPTQNALKSSGGFENTQKTFNHRPNAASRRDGGVKFLDIEETPEALRKKKKELEAEQKVQKQKEKEEARIRVQEEKEARKQAALARLEANKQAAALQKAAKSRQTADAGVHMPSRRSTGTVVEDGQVDLEQDFYEQSQSDEGEPLLKKSKVEQAEVPREMPDYAAGLVAPSVMDARRETVPVPGVVPGYQITPRSGISVRPIQSSAVPVGSRGVGVVMRPPPVPVSPETNYLPSFPTSSQESRVRTPPYFQALQPPPIMTANPAVSPVSYRLLNQNPSQSQQLQNSQVKQPVYSITKEVMQEAQEMFRTANKLSRPEKALILGFMAGNRENPCPQMGQILTVRLSESKDSIQGLLIETFFQMNYNTGEWKRLRKTKPLVES